MSAIGSVWGAGTWTDDAWGDGSWGDAGAAVLPDWIVVGLFKDVGPRVSLAAADPRVALVEVLPRVTVQERAPEVALSPLEYP